jgi:hypothetical protein
METQPPSLGRRTARTMGRLLVTLLVVALSGGVLFLLSELNSRSFSLQQVGDHLVVNKGRFLPMGARPYYPDDPEVAEAYAPLPLQGVLPPGLTERTFNDRESLDRALFDVIDQMARPKLASDTPEVLEQGLAYLRRAERLAGISPEQRTRLAQMQAEVAFFQARRKLDAARKQIAEALAQLKLAAQSNSRHARQAHTMLTELGPLGQSLEEALRKAVVTPPASTPPPEAATPPAAETPPAPAAADDAGVPPP